MLVAFGRGNSDGAVPINFVALSRDIATTIVIVNCFGNFRRYLIVSWRSSNLARRTTDGTAFRGPSARVCPPAVVVAAVRFRLC